MIPIAIILVVSGLVSGAELPSSVDIKLKQVIDEQLNSWKDDIGASLEKFYWEPKKEADDLIYVQGQSEDGFGLKAMSNTAARIETVKLSIVYGTLAAVHDRLVGKGEPIAQLQVERAQTALAMDSDLASLLWTRTGVRAMVDGINSSLDSMKRMAIYGNRYVLQGSANQTEYAAAKLENFVQEVFVERALFADTLASFYEEYLTKLGNYCEKSQLDCSGPVPAVQTALDRMIDETMGCAECSTLHEPDMEKFGAYSMFRSFADVQSLVATHVDASVLKSLTESEAACEGEVEAIREEELVELTENDLDEIAAEFVPDDY